NDLQRTLSPACYQRGVNSSELLRIRQEEYSSFAIAQDESDLLNGLGGIDRDRHAATIKNRVVSDAPLRTALCEKGYGLPRLQPRRAETGGQSIHALTELRSGDVPPFRLVLEAHDNAGGPPLDGPPEELVDCSGVVICH